MADETQVAMDAAADAGKSATDAAAQTANAGADAAAGAAKSAADTATNYTQRAMDGAKRAGDAMKATGERMNEGRSTLGLKMIEQAETNAHEAFEAMRAAARAKDMTEIMRIQADYLRGQSSRSMEQAREIGEMIARFGRDTAESLKR